MKSKLKDLRALRRSTAVLGIKLVPVDMIGHVHKNGKLQKSTMQVHRSMAEATFWPGCGDLPVSFVTKDPVTQCIPKRCEGMNAFRESSPITIPGARLEVLTPLLGILLSQERRPVAQAKRCKKQTACFLEE